MRTVVDIYEEYRIPPWLQEHQLRVAAVGKSVCDAYSGPLSADDVIKACLFHDMGNIIKSDFSPNNPLASLVGSADIEYWRRVQDDFIAKYGSDEEGATIVIARELGLSERVIGILESFGFGKLKELLFDPSYEKKIAEYGDLRVGPFGVMSVRDRAEEGRVRYRARYKARGIDSEDYFDQLLASGEALEKQIFEHCRIRPENITDVSITPIVEELKKYAIS